MTSAAANPPKGSSPARKREGRPSPLVLTLAIVVALGFAFVYLTRFYTDWLWYDQLGFREVLTVRWISLAVMFLIGFAAMALPLWGVMQLAYRTRPMYAQLNSQLDRYQEMVEPLRKAAMVLIPLVFGLFAGTAAASQWETAQLWLHRQSFGEVDPQFGIDLGFYLFQVPFYRQALTFLQLVAFACFAAVVAISYLYGSLRIGDRTFRVARTTRILLATLAAIWVLALGVNAWMGMYASLADRGRGTVRAGAGFAEVNAGIPATQIFAVSAVLVALLFIVTAVIGRWRLPLIGTAMLVVISLLAGSAYPALIQRFQVDPSARTLEAEYIERNIAATRAAYGVTEVEKVPTDTTTTTRSGQLAEDAQTTANLRIMDPALVSGAFQNLQSFRQYYRFSEDLNVDRYVLDGEIRDTVIAVRELNLEWLNASDQSWYNRHLVYTHGYGVVAANGNDRGPEGQPVFMQQGIPTRGDLGDYEPRIYFGESVPEYAIVGAPEGAQDRELDYPRGDGEAAGNAMTTFQGEGGPSLGNFFHRLVYAIHFGSEQIILSDAVNEESQILYHRDPHERVQRVAPYLTLDNTAYPAVVDGRVVWIVDAFTTSAEYPYSTAVNMPAAVRDSATQNPRGMQNPNINYIRNSVKAVVDAYDGSVTLYAWDVNDPVLQAWQGVYPSTLTPMDEMSGDLMAHVRYPQDLFKVQRFILGQYHVTDPGTFYSGDDQWRTPKEPTWPQGEAQNAPFQPPYYLTMSVGEQDPAFTLYSTYVPVGGNLDVLYGYLSVNADAGNETGKVSPEYGKLIIQELAKDQSVPGPGQVQNIFNTDNAISVELNILERGATSVMRGNLLTVPVGGGLLYVQPVYLRSTSNTSYPVLRKILVAFGDNIAFADTLDEALDQLFGGDSGAEAGDQGRVTEADGVEVTEDGQTAEDPEASASPSPSPSPTPAPAPQGDRDQLLQQAKQALDDREEALRNNDLAAFAEADERLQQAVEQLIALEEGQ